MIIETISIWILKIFGVLWIMGGFYVIRQARVAIFVESAISALEAFSGEDEDEEGAEKDDGESAKARPAPSPPDTGRSQWLVVGGLLTIASGVGLVLSHRYTLVPLTLLVIHQGLYAWRQQRRAARALTAKQVAEEIMTPEARNGAMTAAGIWVLTVVLVWTGAMG